MSRYKQQHVWMPRCNPSEGTAVCVHAHVPVHHSPCWCYCLLLISAAGLSS